MRNKVRAPGVLVGVFAAANVAMLSSIAQAGNTLPNAFLLLQTQKQSGTFGGVAGQTVLSSGNLSVTPSTKSTASATLSTTGAVPDVTLNATASYTQTSGSAPFAEATAEAVYVLTITGPTNGAAKVDVSFSAKVTGAFGVTEALTGYYLKEITPGGTVSIDSNTGTPTISGGTVDDLFDNGDFGLLTSSTSTPVQVGTSTYNNTLSVGVGGTFLVALSVDAEVDPTVGISGGFPPPASISAVIDPMFSIDASTVNASAYSISYSSGITAAPEPASLGILSMGTYVVWRRRRQMRGI
jgi:hypothetical protein